MSSRGKRVIGEVLAEAQRLGSYDVGVTIEGLARRLGISPSRVLKLNSNENFFVPIDFLRGILRKAVEEIDPRIYPRDEIKELKEAFSQYVNIDPDQVVIGTGSDQLIDILCRMTLRRGDEAVAISPTFSIYRRCTEIQGAIYKPVSLREDFSLDVEAMLDAAASGARLMFLCSPNNPTANQFSREDIVRLAEGFDGVVAVDEAYVDFSDGSVVDLTGEFENIIVFRTFSKVFGLAGLRIGFAVANPGFARVMDEKFQMPYNVSLLAVKAALMILSQLEVIHEAIRRIRIERERLIRELNSIRGVEAFPSETNFVLFQVERSSGIIYERLLEKGVIIRNIGRVVNRENCLRVTVAPSPMIDRFLESLREVMT